MSNLSLLQKHDQRQLPADKRNSYFEGYSCSYLYVVNIKEPNTPNSDQSAYNVACIEFKRVTGDGTQGSMLFGTGNPDKDGIILSAVFSNSQQASQYRESVLQAFPAEEGIVSEAQKLIIPRKFIPSGM